MTGVPARGWYVEVDDPQTSHTWTPDIIDDPQVSPGANDYPRISIPVRKRDRWRDSRYEGTDMRVWKDGERQPIGTLEDIGETPEKLTLNGRGGTELDARVQEEYQQKEAHVAADEIIDTYTSYVSNVDAPDVTINENELLQSADTTSEFQNNNQTFPDDLPLTITSGTLTTQQTCAVIEAETSSVSGSFDGEHLGASDGTVLAFGQDPGGDPQYSATFDHDVPAGNEGFAYRWQPVVYDYGDDLWETPGLDVKLNDSTITTFSQDGSLGDNLGQKEEHHPLDVLVYNAADGTYTDVTSEATDLDSTTTFTAEVDTVDDALYVSGPFFTNAQLNAMRPIFDTVGSGTWDIQWEYYDGSSWTALPSEWSDTDLQSTGSVSGDLADFASSWNTVSIDGKSRRWLRGRVVSTSSVSQAPIIEQIRVESGPIFWRTNTGLDTGGWTAGDSQTVTFDVTTAQSMTLDAVAIFDDRYSYTFDNDTNGLNGHLAGPEEKPELVEIETVDATTAFQVVGGRLEVTIDDTSNQQYVAISQDRGQTYTTANNSDTVETDWGSGTPQIRAKFGLSRYGSGRSQTPTEGYLGQTIDLYDLKADIDETPLLVNQDYDGTVHEVLQQIADYGDFIFEYRRTDTTESIEWTQPGQRVASSTPEPSNYDYNKTIEGKVERVVIKGGRQQQREETFTSNHGTAVDLQQGNIDHGTEAVYDPSTGERFTEGEDYQLSPGIESNVGSITTLSSGAMSDATEYAIDYAWHPEGVWTDPSAGASPKTIVRSLPPATTERGCGQAAQQLGRQLDEPLEKVTVSLPTSEVGFGVVEAQQFASLPSDTAFEIREIETTAEQTVFTLGSRESVGEAFSRLRRRLSAAARRT